MKNLDGKTALVTGGTRGIGLAIVNALASSGADIVIGGSRPNPAAERHAAALRQDGRRAHYVAADIASPEDCARLFDEAEALLGKIDVVVSVAGSMRPAAIAEATVDDYTFNFSVNALGTFLTLSQAARRVADGGRIIATSTNLTRLPRARMGLYQASKAAVEQMIFRWRVSWENARSPPMSSHLAAPTPRCSQMHDGRK